MKKLTIDWEVYVREKDIPKQSTPAKKKNNLPYVMCRTYSAWVFAWYLKKRVGKEVELIDARRIWKRDWASSLSQLAMEWTSKPNWCQFPCEVDSVELMEAIEIIPITEKARLSIHAVPVWKQ